MKRRKSQEDVDKTMCFGCSLDKNVPGTIGNSRRNIQTLIQRNAMPDALNRREFWAAGLVGTAALTMPGILLQPQPILAATAKSWVILGMHRQIVGADEKIAAQLVRPTIEEVLMALLSKSILIPHMLSLMASNRLHLRPLPEW